MTTLATRIMPIENTAARNALLAVAGSLLVAVAAQITVPFWPVPMTLQTLAVLLVGGAYGARLGAATIALYAAEGAIGLPFFAKGASGLAYLLHGTTTGYIAGFILAAAFIGFVADRGWLRSPIPMALAAFVASALVYIPGLLWLGFWFGLNKNMDAASAASAAVMGGFVPFILGDVLKAAIAGLSLSGAWSLLKK